MEVTTMNKARKGRKLFGAKSLNLILEHHNKINSKKKQLATSRKAHQHVCRLHQSIPIKNAQGEGDPLGKTLDKMLMN